MTAAPSSSLPECREVCIENTEMLNDSHDGPQLTSGPCLGASLSTCTSTGSPLDRKVVGASSGMGFSQQPHSASLSCENFTQTESVSSLKTDSSTSVCSSNKENRSLLRSYSETSDRLPAGGSSQVNLNLYKTELCHPFRETGICSYGKKCQFAHGMHELRTLTRHPKYKTELCRTFHTTGICSYGSRCNFIHNAEECRKLPPLSALNKRERPRLQYSFSFSGFPTSGGLLDSPASVTSPRSPMENQIEGQNNPFTYCRHEFTSLLSPSLAPPDIWESEGLVSASPTTTCVIQPTAESPLGPSDSF